MTFRSQPVLLRHPIRTDYANFLDQIANYSEQRSHISTPAFTDLINLEIFEELDPDEKLSLQVQHSLQDNIEQFSTYKLISGAISRMRRAVRELVAENGKTGGAAVKRRMRSIQSFKSAKSDYSLLLSTTRGAIASTMRMRRYIQDTTEDEQKYIELRDKVISYTSKQFIADKDSIEIILNSDINYLLISYKTAKAALNQVNNLVREYNEVVRNNQEQLVQEK